MAGPEPWINGMVDADTYDTERRLATKQVIANLRQVEGIIATGQTVKPRCGHLPDTRDGLGSECP